MHIICNFYPVLSRGSSNQRFGILLGLFIALRAMSFGADDFDGTISNTTKIYSMAGSEQNPGLSDSEITELLNDAGFVAVERDSEYRML